MNLDQLKHSDLSNLSLNDQTKFRLNGINKIKDYFEFEVKERETKSKKLSKSIASVDYSVICNICWSKYYISCKCYRNTYLNNKFKFYFGSFFNYGKFFKH